MNTNQRFLCFDLGKEEFAIPLLTVKEVLAIPEITPVPQTPPHFLGIMNLRGQVISVMDLRLKLGVKAGQSDEVAVVILDLQHFFLGVVVDRVNSVQEVSAEECTQRPTLDNSKANEYVVNVFKKNDKLILNLDINKALSLEEKTILAGKSGKAA